jgi:hypothetical protein
MAERKDVGQLFNKRWLLVVAYVAIIFTLSAQPGLKVPGDFLLKDKVAHALEYSGLSLLMYGAVRASWPDVPAGRRVLLTLLAIAGLAVCDELFQRLIPNRDSSPFDWMADMVGALLLQLVCIAREQRRRGT